MQCIKCNKKIYANETCVCGEKAPKKNNGGVGVNSVICFILLMISVFSLIMTLSLRTVVNKNMLVEAIENIELAEIKVDENKKLDQYIYEEYIDDERITVENVDNLLENPFIKDFLIEKVEDFQEFALDKGDFPDIPADEIVKLIEDNEELLYNEAGLRFLEPDKAELRENLSVLDEMDKSSHELADNSLSSKYVQTFFSYANVIFLVIFMAVIFIQWFVVYNANSRRAEKMMSKYGTSVIISSGSIFATSVASFILMKILPELDILNELITPIVITFLVYSAVLLALGIVITVISAKLNNKFKLIYKNEEVNDNGMDTVSVESSEVPVIETVSEPAVELQPVVEVAPKEIKTGKVCQQCNHENKENAAFCSRCGNKLN